MSRRRRVVWLVATALVVATVVGDRVMHSTIEARIAGRAGCMLRSSDVTASLRSLTTLPHLATGELGTVDVRACDARRNGMPLDVTASLHGVRTDGRVATSTETVAVPYQPVLHRRGAGMPASPGRLTVTGIAGDGRDLLIHAPAAQFGVPVDVSATLTTTSDSVTITPTRLSMLGHTIPVAAIRGVLGARDPRAARGLHPRTISLPASSQVRIDTVVPRPDAPTLRAHTARSPAPDR